MISSRHLSKYLLYQMERHRQVVSDRIQVSVSRKIGIALTDLGRCRSSPSFKRNEQDETFVVPFTFHRRDRRYPVGDQLQKEVQYWLSPPDPSTNQNFVSKARHEGTGAWFFESSALTEWKAKGSLLWIHGKRMSIELSMNALYL